MLTLDYFSARKLTVVKRVWLGGFNTELLLFWVDGGAFAR